MLQVLVWLVAAVGPFSPEGTGTWKQGKGCSGLVSRKPGWMAGTKLQKGSRGTASFSMGHRSPKAHCESPHRQPRSRQGLQRPRKPRGISRPGHGQGQPRPG